MQELAMKWIGPISSLKPGEELLIPVYTKAEQRQMTTAIASALRAAFPSAIKASSFVATNWIHKGQLFIKVKRKPISPTVGYKIVDGQSTRVTISDPEQLRRIGLMLQDNLSKEDIMEIEGLTEIELTKILKEALYGD